MNAFRANAAAAFVFACCACAAVAQPVIDTLTPADVERAIALLKENYINSDALNEAELNRALLSGLSMRLGSGFQLVAKKADDANVPPAPLFSELLGEHIGYVRLGAIVAGNLQAFDAALQNFTSKNADALVVDLRASGDAGDFASAAECADRLTAKGKPLFSLRKASDKKERTFASQRDAAFTGMMIVLADGDTAGAAEALAAVLRAQNKAMVIGQPTAGRAVEYAEMELPSGKWMRIAVAEAVLSGARSIFPEGVKPDLPVEMSAAEKREVFRLSTEQGMGPFVFEKERPHLNEAALLAGANPELDAIEAAQRRGARGTEKALRDPVLQRAVDLVTSLAVFQKR